MESKESNGERLTELIPIIPRSAITTEGMESLFSILASHLFSSLELCGYVSATESKSVISSFLTVELDMDGTLWFFTELSSELSKQLLYSLLSDQTNDVKPSTSREF